MEYKKLTNHEVRLINYHVQLDDRVAAYRRAYPASINWLTKTIKAKADAFFDSDRVKYFRGFKNGGVVVVDEADLMTMDDIKKEVDKVPAVGAHNGGGHPSLYRPEYPQMMIDYFNVGPCTIEKVSNNETGEFTTTTITNALPTKAGFAAKLLVSVKTLHQWAKKVDKHGDLVYPEFALAFEIVDAMVENILVTNTLMGHYQPAFAQFYAKNKLGYKDKSDLVLEGGEKPIISINAAMTPEEAAIIYKESLNQKG